MAPSKRDAAVGVGIALLLLGGKKAAAAAKAAAAPSHPLAPKPTTDDAGTDGAKLVARATQNAAMQWVTIFADLGLSPLEAAALGRWAGIESSGNAHAVSKLGERGLLQAGPHTVDEGGMTPHDWDAYSAAGTSSRDVAALSKHYVDWLFAHAATHIDQAPVDPIDRVWYAKMWHQWPVDVRDGHFHGSAADMARELQDRWASDKVRMHRLRAANVVAFGEPTL